MHYSGSHGVTTVIAQRGQGAHPPSPAPCRAQAAVAEQLRQHQPARGHPRGRHQPHGLLPALRRHGGARPRAGRGVLRHAAHDAARGASRPVAGGQRHPAFGRDGGPVREAQRASLPLHRTGALRRRTPHPPNHPARAPALRRRARHRPLCVPLRLGLVQRGSTDAGFAHLRDDGPHGRRAARSRRGRGRDHHRPHHQAAPARQPRRDAVAGPGRGRRPPAALGPVTAPAPPCRSGGARAGRRARRRRVRADSWWARGVAADRGPPWPGRR